MHRILLMTTLLLSAPGVTAAAVASEASVVVRDPFLDLHSGPGRGFPVTQVVDRGDAVELLRQRTDWIKVRTDTGREGWVNRAQLERTLTPEGDEVRLAGPGPEARTQHRWEAGVGAGDFDGADMVTVSGAYALSDSLFVRADASQLLGEYSNGWLGTIGLSHTFMPSWRVSPFVGIGGGIVYIEPATTLVQSKNRSNGAAYGSVGLRGYLSDRFLLQAEYRQFVVFTDTNDNEVINEWTVGFTHFF
jgi:hypothetical protein